MMDRETTIKGLQIERECVFRDCDRDCGKCDLVQDKEWLLAVYDGALELLKEQEAVVRCKYCKYGEQLFSDYISCQISDENESGCHASHRPEWFCADGERRE